MPMKQFKINRSLASGILAIDSPK